MFIKIVHTIVVSGTQLVLFAIKAMIDDDCDEVIVI